MENEKISRKNKTIIAAVILSLAIAAILYVLCNSTFSGTLSFHFLTNTRTGEQIGIVGCLVYFVFVGFVFGLLFSSFLCLVALLTFYYLHRKDKNLYNKRYHPPYEDEFFYGGKIARISGFSAVGFLILLDAIGLITIHVF